MSTVLAVDMVADPDIAMRSKTINPIEISIRIKDDASRSSMTLAGDDMGAVPSDGLTGPTASTAPGDAAPLDTFDTAPDGEALFRDLLGLGGQEDQAAFQPHHL